MKTLNIPIAVLCVLLINLSACKKDKLPGKPSGYSIGDISEFFSQYGAPTQDFTIDASISTQIRGAEGTIISFWANSLLDNNNQPVSGNVNIQIREIYDRTGMVMSNKPTTSDGEILISGGEVYIKATQNGNELHLANWSSVMINMPTNNVIPGMQVFYGSVRNDILNWTPADSSWVNTSQDSIGQWFYDFLSTQLSWINCDRFYNDPNPRTNVTLFTQGDYTSKNTAVFMVLNDENSVMRIYPAMNQDTVFMSSNIPEGLNITLAAIAEINDIYYSAFKTTQITTNLTESLTFSETTPSAFETALDNL